MVRTHNKAIQLSYLITQKKIKMLFDNVFPEKKIKWQETGIMPNKQLRNV